MHSFRNNKICNFSSQDRTSESTDTTPSRGHYEGDQRKSKAKEDKRRGRDYDEDDIVVEEDYIEGEEEDEGQFEDKEEEEPGERGSGDGEVRLSLVIIGYQFAGLVF